MRRWLLISLGLTVVATAASLVVWFAFYDRLADPLPVHWNIKGEPDDWVARDRALPYLLLPPGIMALFLLLGLAIPWLSPRQYDVERFRPAFEHVWVLLMALFAYLHVVLLTQYLQAPVDGIRLMVGGLLLFFAFLGNVMGQVRRNFWIGVRTPWTLASEAVWIQTHRVAAWLWVGLGLVGGLAVLLGAPLLPVFVVFIVCVLFPVFYSLWVYKRLERQGKLPEQT